MSESVRAEPEESELPDREDVVDLWMAAQLLIERRFYRAVGQNAGRRVRLVTLLELDTLTQLPDAGDTVEGIAAILGVEPRVARATVRNLVRRSLLVRERSQDGLSVVKRTSQADSLIELIRETQATLLVDVLEKLSPNLQKGLLEIMQSGTITK